MKMVFPHDSLSAIGKRIKASRIDAGLTSEEISEKTGISRAALYRYESGYPPKIDILVKLADLLNIPLASLLGIGTEYISSATDFFNRMKQLETDAEHLSVLFGPISYLLTTDLFDEVLTDVLKESIPLNVADSASAMVQAEEISDILKQRKSLFRQRQPNIVSLVSAGELRQFYKNGFIGCPEPSGANISKRRAVAEAEILNIIKLLKEQPIGIQVGVLVDSLPGSSFQIFRQSHGSTVAVSPFRLGSFANVRIGVATITSETESVKRHTAMTEKLWRMSLKGEEAASYLKRNILET